MEVVKIDMNLRAYVFQRQNDHFPLPCPSLTHVDVWEGDRSNWKMDTPAHRRVIATYPFTRTWKMHVTPMSSPILDPGAAASSSGVNDAHLEEEEPQPKQGGTSYRYHRQQDWRRRTREQREEELEDSIITRLDRMQAQSDQRWKQQN